ncbi:MAG: peptidylprolyl isomerase [Alphaproteobacteria bacterium]|nr:peptidylprolyl isomerase [Alphaproteobacteria bacterium]
MYRFLMLVILLTNGIVKAEPPSSSRIAAVVNKGIITQADLMNRLRLATITSGLEPNSQNFEKIKPQILRIMIDEQLQFQAGQKYKIEINQEQIKQAISNLEESNGMPKGSIARMLKDNNIPLKSLEDQIHSNLIWVELIREKFTPTLQIADWEIDQELKLQKERDTKTQHHLAEIVLPFDGPEQEERVKSDLANLIVELEKGAHFSALAQQFSQSATSAQGGDMGWLTEDQLELEVREFLSHLQPGQLSQPIRTPRGYILLAYLEKKLPTNDAQMLVKTQQVLLPFPKNVTEDVARAIMVKAEEISQESKSCVDLENIAKSKFPSSVSRMSKGEPLSNLPGPLQEIVHSLPLNQASKPLLSNDGGVIIMVCEKKSQKVAELKKEDIQAIIAERKLSLLARRELRDLKRHAFIDVRM